MIRYMALPIVVAGALSLSGCFDGDSSSSDDADILSQVRIIHASPDAPPVNILINGEAAAENADYKQVALLRPAVGSYDVAVEGIIPGGNVTVIGPQAFTFEENLRYNVVAAGNVADIGPIVFEDQTGFSSSDQARVRIGHLAPNVRNVDIYVTAAGEGDDLSVINPLLSDVPFETVAEPVEVAAGDYRIQVTATGSATAVFDSGQINLPAGADLFVGAVQNTGANFTDTDAGPISLIVVNGEDVSEIYDADQGAGVRVVHNSANAPEVDVLVDNTPALTNIGFGETAPAAFLDGYAELAGGDYNVKVAASADNSVVPIEENLTIAAGQGYSVLAVGLLNDASTPIEALVLEDSVRSIATQASLRVVHGSTAAGNVNVYLLPQGQTEIGNSEPVLADVPFKAVTGYLALPEATYNLRVTDLDGNVAISADDVALANGAVYTVIARDGQVSGGSAITDFGLILLDDFIAIR